MIIRSNKLSLIETAVQPRDKNINVKFQRNLHNRIPDVPNKYVRLIKLASYRAFRRFILSRQTKPSVFAWN